MKYLIFLLVLTPLVPSLVFLILLFYDVNIAFDIFDRIANALAPLARILLSFAVLLLMPFYLSKKAICKNLYAKWLTIAFVIFLITVNPSFGISDYLLSKLYYKNFADEIFIRRNSDLILHLIFFLQGSIAGLIVLFSRAIPVLIFFIASIYLERKFSGREHG